MSTNWDWYALAVDAAVFSLLYAARRTYNSNYKLIQNAPNVQLCPTLTELVKEKGSLPYVCVSGDVEPTHADRVITHTHTTTPAVIHTRQIVEHGSHRVQGFWSHRVRELSTNTRSVDFTLRVPNGERVHISAPETAEQLEMSLDTVHDSYTPTNTSLASSIMDRIMGDVSKGVQETERILAVGTRLVGLGKLVLSVHSGELTLEKPDKGLYILSKLSKSGILEQVGRTRWILSMLLRVSVLVGVGIVAYTMRKWYKALVEKMQKKRFQERVMRLRALQQSQASRNQTGNRAASDNAAADDHSDDDVSSEDDLCVVCKENKRDVIMLDCAHLCVCVRCSQQLPTPVTCPVCRTPVHTVTPVFFS